MIDHMLSNLASREQICWQMSKVFLENKDAHGLHDMGVEIQALQRAINELSTLKGLTNEK
jgi:hypothetical protein